MMRLEHSPRAARWLRNRDPADGRAGRGAYLKILRSSHFLMIGGVSGTPCDSIHAVKRVPCCVGGFQCSSPDAVELHG